MKGREPAVAWVLRLLPLIDTEHLPVHLRPSLVGLASFADADGSSAFPSPASVSAMFGRSPGTIRRHFAELDELGITERVGWRAAGEHMRTIERRINREVLANLAQDGHQEEPRGEIHLVADHANTEHSAPERLSKEDARRQVFDAGFGDVHAAAMEKRQHLYGTEGGAS